MIRELTRCGCRSRIRLDSISTVCLLFVPSSHSPCRLPPSPLPHNTFLRFSRQLAVPVSDARLT